MAIVCLQTYCSANVEKLDSVSLSETNWLKQSKKNEKNKMI